ncbi:hypothetical protein FRB94_007835 [Tulasnella sp. JGI-2019a]|nr:hypothetical protein FRB93_002542 [Tulasnella sp. JGI-2019a]KAG8997147.1 hypothetical protein FRB94_007835 [Tulasnella sp. JGI-2019a]
MEQSANYHPSGQPEDFFDDFHTYYNTAADAPFGSQGNYAARGQDATFIHILPQSIFQELEALYPGLDGQDNFLSQQWLGEPNSLVYAPPSPSSDPTTPFYADHMAQPQASQIAGLEPRPEPEPPSVSAQLDEWLESIDIPVIPQSHMEEFPLELPVFTALSEGPFVIPLPSTTGSSLISTTALPLAQSRYESLTPPSSMSDDVDRSLMDPSPSDTTVVGDCPKQECPFCHKLFSNLRRHKRLNCPVRPVPPVECQICGSRLKGTVNLPRHLTSAKCRAAAGRRGNG